MVSRHLAASRSFLACAFALACATARAAPDPHAELVAARLEAAERPVCAAVGTVGAASRLVFACSRSAGKPAFDRDSVFEIGSISKAFTGLLLAEMVARGELALADAAAKHAPAGAKLPRRGREITLADLATHASSLPRLPPGFVPVDAFDPYRGFDADALYAALARTELARDVGTAVEYSNFGYLWLSELLGRRAGKPWDQLVAERVLAPLGMKSTGVRLAPKQAARLVQGHDLERRPVPPWTLAPELAGAGGLRASAGDMLRFAESVAGRRETPLAPVIAATFTKMRPVGLETNMAIGWGMRERPVGRLFFHNGATGGHRAILVANPDARTAAFVLSDSEANLDDLALHLVDPSLPIRKLRVAIAMQEAKLEEFVGEYRLAPDFTLAVARRGARLFAGAAGQGAVEIFAEAPDQFFAREIEAQFAFRRGADGRVEEIVLYQGGREIPGARVK